MITNGKKMAEETSPKPIGTFLSLCHVILREGKKTTSTITKDIFWQGKFKVKRWITSSNMLLPCHDFVYKSGLFIFTESV